MISFSLQKIKHICKKYVESVCLNTDRLVILSSIVWGKVTSFVSVLDI